MRMADYKLIRFFEGDRYELYNLRNDIGEKHNLALEMPEQLEKMKKILVDWSAGIGARIHSAILTLFPGARYMNN